MTLKEKLISKFGDRLCMEISAVKDEGLMRECIDEGCHRIFLKSLVPGEIPTPQHLVKLTAIEIGTYHGVSAALLAEYFSHVTTIDIVKERGGYYKDIGLCDEIWCYLEIRDRINFKLVKDDTNKKRFIDVLGESVKKFDMAFIDGRHKGGIETDYEILKPYCDVFLFHDYEPDAVVGSIGNYVSKFVDSIPGGKIVLSRPPFALWVKDEL